MTTNYWSYAGESECHLLWFVVNGEAYPMRDHYSRSLVTKEGFLIQQGWEDLESGGRVFDRPEGKHMKVLINGYPVTLTNGITCVCDLRMTNKLHAVWTPDLDAPQGWPTNESSAERTKWWVIEPTASPTYRQGRVSTSDK
jgi:hypothetical protein